MTAAIPRRSISGLGSLARGQAGRLLLDRRKKCVQGLVGEQSGEVYDAAPERNDYETAMGFRIFSSPTTAWDSFCFTTKETEPSTSERFPVAPRFPTAGNPTRMGVAFSDYDNDGSPDIAVTNLALEKYALFTGTRAVANSPIRA